MMYDELIEQLRIRASWLEFEIIKTPSKTEGNRDAILFRKAAYAINDLITALTASNEVIAKSKPKWIPVTERLPEKDGKYLTVHTLNSIPPQPWIEVCWFAKDLYKVDKYDFHDKKKKSGFYQYDSEWGNFERTGISHWMPLPQPPEDE